MFSLRSNSIELRYRSVLGAILVTFGVKSKKAKANG